MNFLALAEQLCIRTPLIKLCRPENLKKYRPKQLVKRNKSISRKNFLIFSIKIRKKITKNCILVWSFKLFPSSKIDVWPFLKSQKMEFAQKNYLWNWYFWFHEFFGLYFFKFSGLLLWKILLSLLLFLWLWWYYL